jgi:hypothetical protein
MVGVAAPAPDVRHVGHVVGAAVWAGDPSGPAQPHQGVVAVLVVLVPGDRFRKGFG